jgi:hypothetical protein
LPQVGLEDIWTCIDYHAKFPKAFGRDWGHSGDLLRELRSRQPRFDCCSVWRGIYRFGLSQAGLGLYPKCRILTVARD